MRQGVYDADMFILFLTNSVLSRPFCLMEIGWAIEFEKPILIVTEKEERFWPWDITRWRTDCCTRVRGQWVQGDLSVRHASCPQPVKQLVTSLHDTGASMPFRRRDFEVRCSWWLSYYVPIRCGCFEHSARKERCVDAGMLCNSKHMMVFCCCTGMVGFCSCPRDCEAIESM